MTVIRFLLAILVCASISSCVTTASVSNNASGGQCSMAAYATSAALICALAGRGSTADRAKLATVCAVAASTACFVIKRFASQQVKTLKEVEAEVSSDPSVQIKAGAEIIESTVTQDLELQTGATFSDSHNVRVNAGNVEIPPRHDEKIEILHEDGTPTGIAEVGAINPRGDGGEFKINFTLGISQNLRPGNYKISRTLFNGSIAASLSISTLRVVNKIIEPAGRKDFPVFYATNRQVRTISGSLDYVAERAPQLSFGLALVTIPGKRKFGSFEPTIWQKLILSTDGQINVTKITALSEQDAFNSMRIAHNQTTPQDRELLLYIHGYNTTFKDGLLRAAQLGYDLKIRGLTAYFSWPSAGTTNGYPADEAAVEASEQFLSSYISKLADMSGATTIHIIAHSMGNRGLLRALQRLQLEQKLTSGAKLGQIILAAPDVDADLFKDLSASATAGALRTTVYVCSVDKALQASGWLHSGRRAGLAPPVTVVSGADTVYFESIEGMMGHGYFTENTALYDMFDLIRSNETPGRRQRLSRQADSSGKTFWILN